ncbi:MAG TPA: class I SAM-dependent methyltransferase [Blastocatellia bacterium]
MNQSPEEIVNAWRESALYWDKHRAAIKKMFAAVTRALIEEAAITEGHRVLDVAGGAGEPSLTIAEIVGARGSVVCTDVAPEMVEAARREAQRLDLKNISCQQCPADELPFEDESFDRAVSRFGVMFFPDPLAAIRGMMRVVKPAGRIAFAVWHDREFNPFFGVVTEVLSRYIDSPPEDPDAPGAFRFAEAGKLAGLLSQAGATGVKERMFSFQIDAPVSFEEFWALRSEMSDTLREKLKRLSQNQISSLVRDLKAASRDYFPNQRMSFPAEVIIVSGTK